MYKQTFDCVLFSITLLMSLVAAALPTDKCCIVDKDTGDNFERYKCTRMRLPPWATYQGQYQAMCEPVAGRTSIARTTVLVSCLGNSCGTYPTMSISVVPKTTATIQGLAIYTQCGSDAISSASDIAWCPVGQSGSFQAANCAIGSTYTMWVALVDPATSNCR